MDWLSTIIGVAIGFLSSIGVIIAERLIDMAGKLKVYYVIVSGETITNSFGISESRDGDSIFVVPMILELMNTSNATRVMRDVSLLIYKDNRCIARMLQISIARAVEETNGEVSERNENEYGGEKHSYSFVLPPRSIQRQLCNFMYERSKKPDSPEDFDEIRLRYYDEADNAHIYKVRKIEDGWKCSNFSGDEEWSLLKK